MYSNRKKWIFYNAKLLVCYLIDPYFVLSTHTGTAAAKTAALEKAGVHMTDSPALMGKTILRAIINQPEKDFVAKG